MISDHKINPVGKDLCEILGKGEQREPEEYCSFCDGYYYPSDMIRDKCRACVWEESLRIKKQRGKVKMNQQHNFFNVEDMLLKKRKQLPTGSWARTLEVKTAQGVIELTFFAGIKENIFIADEAYEETLEEMAKGVK